MLPSARAPEGQHHPGQGRQLNDDRAPSSFVAALPGAASGRACPSRGELRSSDVWQRGRPAPYRHDSTVRVRAGQPDQ